MSVFTRPRKPKKGQKKHWHYEFQIRGARHRGAIPEARTKWDAEQAEIKIRQSIYEGKFGALKEAPRLADFIRKVFLPWSKSNKRSWRNDQYQAETLIRHLGKRRLNEIAQIQIERFKLERLAAKTVIRFKDPHTKEWKLKERGDRSPASVNRELALLSRIFSMAIDNGLVTTNPCRKVAMLDEDNERNRYLTDSEEARLLLALELPERVHVRPIVQLAIQTGMRKREILSLRWANVDFQRDLIHVMNSKRERTKTGKSRSIPMNQVLRDELSSIHGHNITKNWTTEYVFCNPATGKPFGDIKKAFNHACDAAGLDDFTFHDLRHTAATRLGDLGVDTRKIMAILGHASMATSARYTHATDEGLRRAMDSLGTRERKEAWPIKAVK